MRASSRKFSSNPVSFNHLAVMGRILVKKVGIHLEGVKKEQTTMGFEVIN